MKVFISADIEGVATTLSHEDCRPGNPNYPYHCDEMTKEVLAACEGAMEAGADEIVIKDAHGPACNIDSKVLPPCAQIIKGWSGHPFLMVEGLDKSFDAALFVGYHSAASREGNPMSHTVSGRPAYIKLNGQICSEFMMFSLCAASLGVPTVYLSGDQQLCEDSQNLHPCLVTTAVKEGTGGALRCLAPQKAQQLIRADVKRALSQPFQGKVSALPEHFTVEVCYKDHNLAAKNAFYPGAQRLDDCTISFETDDYFEVMRFFRFVL